MDPIKVSLYVSTEAALSHGRAASGFTDYTLTDDDVTRMSSLARKWLVRNYDKALHVDVPDSAHVLAALEAYAAKAEESAAQNRGRREEIIAAVLAAPFEAWLVERYSELFVDSYPREVDYMPLGASSIEGDDRVRARRGEVEKSTLFRDRLAQHEQAKREEAERAAAEKVREAQIKEAARSALREIAARYDDFARAAKDGYPVEQQVLDRLAEEFAARVDSPHIAIDNKTWKEPKDRAAPSLEAFALREAACRAANETLPTALGKWDVSRIVRLDACPHDGEHNYVTAVLATLETPIGDRQVTFSLESLECEHEEDD